MLKKVIYPRKDTLGQKESRVESNGYSHKYFRWRLKNRTKVSCTYAEDIPILVGTEKPLLHQQLQPRCPQHISRQRWPHARQFPHGEVIWGYGC